MSRNNLIIISIIAVICIIAALVINSKNQPETGLSSEQLFLPELKEKLNMVDKVLIQHSGNEAIILTKSNDRWAHTEKSNYKANFTAIRDLLTQLAEAKLFEAKTTKEKNYIQLGVEEVTKEKGSGSRVTIYSKEKLLEDIIIGRYKINKGTYLRKAKEKQSWLTQSKLIVQSRALDWLDTNLVNINENNIKSVEYSPIDDTPYKITRNTNNESYKVVHGGKSSAPKNPRFVDNIARLINEIKPVDVAKREGGINKENIFSSRIYKTFDGMTIVAICSKQKEDKTAQITFDFTVPEPANSSNSAQLAQQYRKEFSPWVYTIDDSIFGKFNKQLGDIVELNAK
ncbi:MAG: DUF4340 domain-containing protein [Gammaproteobacteria bacterium]|nr:MAG: DUF4340 domain-containing protein [Gammaproteobacteria bacterium]